MLFNDDFLMGIKVGHEIAALSEHRTFDTLYIQPLLAIIAGQNPDTVFNTNKTTIKCVLS